MNKLVITNDGMAQAIGLVIGKKYRTEDGTVYECVYVGNFGGICLVNECGAVLNVFEFIVFETPDQQGNLVLYEEED